MLITPTLYPPAASLLGCLSPQEAIPWSHGPCQSATARREGPDWFGKGMSQMYVTLIQCLQTNVWDASGCKLWKKQINISQEVQLCTHASIPENCFTCMGQKVVPYNTWCCYCFSYSILLLLQHQICPLSCPMCFCCAILCTDGTADIT